MRGFIEALVGGVVIIIVASVAGVAQNALRSNPVKLIQKVPSAPAQSAAGQDTAAAMDGGAPAPGEDAEAALGEGEITVAEMKRLYDEGLTVILDARGPGEYAEGHVPGSVNIPYDELTAYLETLQMEAAMDQPVVCYCRGPLCDLSHHLATELRLMGYENVRVCRGGWDGWVEQGYPVVTGSEP